MRNKKGFTLIELLAVIIILSVLVVITAPVISNSIENSKRSSAMESANSLIQSAEYYFLSASPKYGKIDVLSDKLSYKGEKPDLGEVEINKQGKSRIYTYVNGYCITKEFGTELYANKMNKEDCSWFGTDNYETTEGTTFTLNNQTIKNYLIYGNSIQDGTPTPDNSAEVKSTGDLLTSSNCASYGSDACSNIGKYVVQVKDRGKNLFDYSYLKQQGSSGGLTMTSTGDVITINGTLTNSGDIKLSDVFPNIFDVNKTYTLKIDVVGGSGTIGEGTGITFAFSLFNSANTKYIRTNVNATALDNIASVTFSGSVFAGEEKLHLLLQNWRLGNTYSNYQVRIQIEEGSSATSYESYKAALTNIYLDEPLRKIGDYADYIDFYNKKIVRRVSSKTFDGTERWTIMTDVGVARAMQHTLTDSKANTTKSLLAQSNYYVGATWEDVYNGKIGVARSKDAIRIRPKETLPTIAEWKAFLQQQNNAGNPLVVNYVLAEQSEETIDLPNIELLDGSSTLLINTEVSPSKVTLTTNK